MELVGGHAFQNWFVHFLAVLFLVGGLAAFAAGVGLIVGSAGTLRFFAVMNRWVSTRRALRPLEVPHDTRLLVQRHRYWLALAIIAGATIAIAGLVTQFDVRAVAFVFGLDARPSSLASWLVESAWWALFVGNLVAIVIANLLVFYPEALIRLETRGGHWFSQRQLVRNADTLNLSLDHQVAAYPRSAGWIIAGAGLLLAGNFGILLLAIR